MRPSAGIVGAILLAALVFVSGSRSAPSTQVVNVAPTAAAAALTPAWTTYHLDNTRSGNDTSEGTVTAVASSWTSITLDGDVYAQPLVYGTSVYVATENNTIYAFNTADGTKQWSIHMGAPADAGTLPCGNISPNVGVTGTPVIDPAAAGGHGVLFMVGMTSEPHYRLFGTDLVTHAVVVDVIVDAGDIAVQGQRGALAVSGGNVYIPYGGRAGDCADFNNTPYYGIVVSRSETNGGSPHEFVPAGTTQSGIWAPGGVSIDGSGNVYAATGNGSGPGTESVFKLSPTLGVIDQWRPSNADSLDSTDQDVGSISPALVGGGKVFQNGKYGHAFLLSSSLAQQNADPGMDACNGLTNDASFGATAYAAPYIYVPCGNGLFAYSETGLTSATTPAWSGLNGSFSGPPIVAGGDVWALANGNLYGFDAVTGAPIANASVGSMSRFESPTTAGGRLFVAGTDYLKAFDLIHGCVTASVIANPPSSQVVPNPVVFTASSTGLACTMPTYEFWLHSPNGTWTMTRAFSSVKTWNWDTTGYPAGNYIVHVWANQAGNPTNTWEAYGSLNYTLTVLPPCATAGLLPAGPTQAAGTPVNFTANSTICPNPQYEFWVQYPDGTWNLKRVFGIATWNWNTAGLGPGLYTVHVWANQMGDPTAAWEAYGTSKVTLTGCATAALSPLNPSRVIGTTVNLIASSTGCAAPLYEFWVQYPDGTWVMKQAFGAGTWNWSTAGLAPGAYTVHVWANQTGDPTAAWEAYGSSVVTLTGCATAALSPSGSSPVGTTIVFTGSSTGCPTPVYEFWLQDTGGAWHMEQAFALGKTWSWDSTGWARGVYHIHVWANQQGADTSSWEAYGAATYTLT